MHACVACPGCFPFSSEWEGIESSSNFYKLLCPHSHFPPHFPSTSLIEIRLSSLHSVVTAPRRPVAMLPYCSPEPYRTLVSFRAGNRSARINPNTRCDRNSIVARNEFRPCSCAHVPRLPDRPPDASMAAPAAIYTSKRCSKLYR